MEPVVCNTACSEEVGLGPPHCPRGQPLPEAPGEQATRPTSASTWVPATQTHTSGVLSYHTSQQVTARVQPLSEPQTPLPTPSACIRGTQSPLQLSVWWAAAPALEPLGQSLPEPSSRPCSRAGGPLLSSPPPAACRPARPRPAPHTHWSLQTGRLLLEGSACLPAQPSRTWFHPAPCLGGPWGSCSKGVCGERLNVGSIYAAEGLGCLPWGASLCPPDVA